MKYLFTIAMLLLAACGQSLGDATSDKRELTQLVHSQGTTIQKP